MNLRLRMRMLLLAVLGTTALMLITPAAPSAGPTADEWNGTVDKALAFLKKSQNPDGSWASGRFNRGVGGIVVTALLQTGKVTPDDEPAKKGLAFIESLINPQAKHIAGPEATVQLQNYVTSVNLMALATANRQDKYKTVITDAVGFLKQLQWDDSENKTEKDDYYGGAGYDSKSRPDLSNTQFFLDALHAAGLPKDDPAYKKALVFVSRCQNLKSEYNDQPWAGKINDGSFIYSAAAGGQTKTDDPKELAGYGSMTYAGIKSMVYCGISRDDPRYKAAFAWISKNYTVDANPGMPEGLEQRGLYYYYHTMAKSLAALGVDEIVDAKGVKHDWRAELTAALAKRQRPDGSWVNPTDRWLEGEPTLVTGYALMALSYCKPK
ncbi:prenyltransferase/squalene oxidase repeat-containing protein [Tuwongella immobilis]|uniref:Squalene cyclase C-terminal domain-containing protein n=1 Tax=Tuwongella immobilis TaxID=692036 RepID=A0A6C2YVS1_9BACT|nr:prenyltransferase/squalene oxidase repeat-containing protein [Tuwongella immobilis]VIP05481.1 signal peptide protein : Prenyltransferase/squalene oxidase OS=Isosphaera pallida (strain ATCC 43644 / DSM 9630 / IS1B) GN=Isop_2195 PE=4 SV=1: Prenyltrans_2 [Tuwongella immobilis]VTS08318.1 signal peptide protein : Prenyltransferase/squalene oxidase OS=Isosphaera pallida (strain ATCC 43644 / DSM 9630 / IS1B) GN=Isop_2195 PE=4 SV=1: Prenyltrans_2 [Tuwongella immobilis]